MTSRELFALAAVGLPALVAATIVLVPRRFVVAVAVAVAVPVSVPSIALSAWILHAPAKPSMSRWLVVDAPGGLLLAVIAVVGLASAFASRAYLAGVPAPRREKTYFATLYEITDITLLIFSFGEALAIAAWRPSG